MNRKELEKTRTERIRRFHEVHPLPWDLAVVNDPARWHPGLLLVDAEGEEIHWREFLKYLAEIQQHFHKTESTLTPMSPYFQRQIA